MRSIAVLFQVPKDEISALAKEHGWPPKSDKTPSERAAAARAAEAAREVDLYGDAATVADVRFLRQQGFVVHREGAGVRVGNTLCTLAGLRAKAARERRQAPARASAGRVGMRAVAGPALDPSSG